MKKILAAILCMGLLTGTLAACGSTPETATNAGDTGSSASKTESTAPANNADMVTVSLFIPTLANYSEEAIAAVQSALNERLAANYGIQTKLMYTVIGNFESTINLAMTTSEVDVTCYFNSTGQLPTYVKNNQLLDITDYLNETGELKSIFTDTELQACTINGRIYGVPRKYQYGGGVQLVMNKDIVEEMGIDPMSIHDMDSVGEVLYQVKEAHPELTYTMVPQSSKEMMWAFPWDRNIGMTSFAYAEDFESTEIKSLFELESFAEICSYTRKWYQDGLIMSDVISNTMEGTDLVSAGTAFCCFHNADIDPLDAFYANTVISDWIVEPHAIATDVANLQYGISANSAHPEEAFKLLTALYTDAELHTLLSFGIEGEHYVINEDGRADYPEGMDSTNEPYGGFAATATYPNYLLNPVKASAILDDYAKAVVEWDDSVNVSATFGYFFDTSGYAEFVTAYTNLEEKYKTALMAGSIPLEEVLPSIKSELESIGFYDVIADTQVGLDAFLAEK